MKIAMLSDLHLGDPACGLVKFDKSCNCILGDKYDAFKRCIGDNVRYLILVGDVFDLSIASYSEVYRLAKFFFQRVAADGLFSEAIIYLPGNHDYSFWNWVMHDANSVKRIMAGKDPKEYRFASPGVLDLRQGVDPEKAFNLPYVTRKETAPFYGGLFIDQFLMGPDGIQHGAFYVVYPNLYILTDHETILVTHGQYWEVAWSLISNFAPVILKDDLGINGLIDIQEIVALNLPVNTFLSSAVGQAGVFTDWVRFIQRQVKEGSTEELHRYVDNFIDKILDPNWGSSWLGEKASDVALNYLRKQLKKRISILVGEYKPSRYKKNFALDEKGRKRLDIFFRAVLAEVETLNRHYGYHGVSHIRMPTKILYGHTHKPVPWDSDNLRIEYSGAIIGLHNFGGWLFKGKGENPKFVGAEVFFIHDGIVSSVNIK